MSGGKSEALARSPGQASPGRRASDPFGLRALWPGIALSAAVALGALFLASAISGVFPVPAMVVALILGILLSPLASRSAFQPGMTFCVKKLLRWAVALLGLRIALGDIVALGIGTAVLVTVGTAVTVAVGFAVAKAVGETPFFGALAGAATAVCGASATLATATVLPNYEAKERDVAFIVVAVNALSTVAMVLYPPLAHALGFSHQTTGIFLGATIHDVAQVVGAGYAVSDDVGNTAVIVKLFRVFLLLPVVLAIGWWFARHREAHGRAKVPVPVFAFVFLGLCLVNSAAPLVPGLLPAYGAVKAALAEASTWGLLVAIAALGLGTSYAVMATLRLRHLAAVVATTLTILLIEGLGLGMIR